MANPGINDRKTKTIISLSIEIPNKIVIFKKKVIIGIAITTFLMYSTNLMSTLLNYQSRIFESAHFRHSPVTYENNFGRYLKHALNSKFNISTARGD
jgi:hypothetical protein